MWSCHIAQIHAGVEERVSAALVRAEDLERELDQKSADHAAAVAKLGNQQQQLEEQLRAARARASTLESHLTVAQEEIKRCAQKHNLFPNI